MGPSFCAQISVIPNVHSIHILRSRQLNIEMSRQGLLTASHIISWEFSNC